jgi:hypothetical protein
MRHVKKACLDRRLVRLEKGRVGLGLARLGWIPLHAAGVAATTARAYTYNSKQSAMALNTTLRFIKQPTQASAMTPTIHRYP